MPPKAKYTREEIAEAAFQMAREKGIEAVVARELGKRLGTSSSPIFTAFKNMEELQEEVRKMAMKEFETYVSDAINYAPIFKHVGMRIVQFASNEPKLLQLLYMKEHKETQSYEDLIFELGDTVEVSLESLEQEHELTREEATLVFKQVWMFTFGICTMVAGKICHFSTEEVSKMLSREFQGTLMLIKSGTFIDKQVNSVLQK